MDVTEYQRKFNEWLLARIQHVWNLTEDSEQRNQNFIRASGLEEEDFYDYMACKRLPLRRELRDMCSAIGYGELFIKSSVGIPEDVKLWRPIDIKPKFVEWLRGCVIAKYGQCSAEVYAALARESDVDPLRVEAICEGRSYPYSWELKNLGQALSVDHWDGKMMIPNEEFGANDDKRRVLES